MSNILKYKDYHAAIECDVERQMLKGKVLNSNIDVDITFEAPTFKLLTATFHNTVDEYEIKCRKAGYNPLNMLTPFVPNVSYTQKNSDVESNAVALLNKTIEIYNCNAGYKGLQLNPKDKDLLFVILCSTFKSSNNKSRSLNDFDLISFTDEVNAVFGHFFTDSQLCALIALVSSAYIALTKDKNADKDTKYLDYIFVNTSCVHKPIKEIVDEALIL